MQLLVPTTQTNAAALVVLISKEKTHVLVMKHAAQALSTRKIQAATLVAHQSLTFQ
jgi:hypothetical protein